MLSYFSGLFVWHRLPALLHQLLNQISIEEKYLDEGKKTHCIWPTMMLLKLKARQKRGALDTFAACSGFFVTDQFMRRLKNSCEKRYFCAENLCVALSTNHIFTL